jgi:hypothetical protein
MWALYVDEHEAPLLLGVELEVHAVLGVPHGGERSALGAKGVAAEMLVLVDTRQSLGDLAHALRRQHRTLIGPEYTTRAELR